MEKPKIKIEVEGKISIRKSALDIPMDDYSVYYLSTEAIIRIRPGEYAINLNFDVSKQKTTSTFIHIQRDVSGSFFINVSGIVFQKRNSLENISIESVNKLKEDPKCIFVNIPEEDLIEDEYDGFGSEDLFRILGAFHAQGDEEGKSKGLEIALDKQLYSEYNTLTDDYLALRKEELLVFVEETKAEQTESKKKSKTVNVDLEFELYTYEKTISIIDKISSERDAKKQNEKKILELNKKSISELESLKKTAVDTEDFERAALINKEIISRSVNQPQNWKIIKSSLNIRELFLN